MRELTIRPADSQDYESFALLFPELETGDRVPSAQRFCDELAKSSIIVERNGHTLGYAYFQLLGTTGYIRNVVVAKEARGRGVGAALMEALRGLFRERGARTWELNVKPDNQAALRLYERCGMRLQHRATALSVQWKLAETLPRPQLAVTARLVAPEDDSGFERALRLLDGQLQGGRALPGRMIVGLYKDLDDAPAGVALFDPGFPGASPFRVLHRSLVGTLLAGLKAQAQPQEEQLGLFIENDAEAVAVLVAAGAIVRLEALHYHGVL